MTVRRRLLALLLGLGLAGVAGPTALRGTETSAAVPGARRAGGEYQRDPWRGGFWRPAGSAAERPRLALEPVRYTPGAPRRGDPNPLFALSD